MDLRRAFRRALALFLTIPTELLPIAIPGALVMMGVFVTGLLCAAFVYAQPVKPDLSQAYKDDGALGALFYFISAAWTAQGVVIATLWWRLIKMEEVYRKRMDDMHAQAQDRNTYTADQIKASAVADQSVSSQLRDLVEVSRRTYELVLKGTNV